MTLDSRPLTYAAVGATADPAMVDAPPAGFRPLKRTALIGHGAEAFSRAGIAVMHWEVQRRSGFVIDGARDVAVGNDVRLLIPLGPFRVTAPARVVYVVAEERRVGFAYGTLAGHPERGEEAFLVHWRADDSVWFELRAFARPANLFFRLGYPILRASQAFYTRRYLRALRS